MDKLNQKEYKQEKWSISIGLLGPKVAKLE